MPSYRANRFGTCMHYCPLYIVIFAAVLLVTAFIATTAVQRNMAAVSSSSGRSNVYFKYTNMKGFFAQDDPATDASKFDYVSTNLGLLNRSYTTDQVFDPQNIKTQWERFEAYVRNLNETAKPGESYKVIYLGRHGEGWHNVEEANVGSPLWNCYWSRLDGDGNITWANAQLTPLGVKQALTANAFWKSATTNAKIPLPESYYVSPLQRCLMTLNYTFNDVPLPPDKPFKPVIKELLREALGVHTCDRRTTKTKIASLWPQYTFEADFSEVDTMWDPDFRESSSHHTNRMLHLLDDICANDTNIFISGTSHSGSINALLGGVGHQQFQLQTGGVIPIFLKAQRQNGPRPDGKIDPPERSTICPPPPGANITVTTGLAPQATIT